MEIKRKADNTLWITDRTPVGRDFKAKAKGLYRELLVRIENNPKLTMPFSVTETPDEIIRAVIK